MAFSIPLMISVAASFQPMYSSIITPERITLPGLILSRFADLGRSCIRQVITIEIGRRNHRILGRTEQQLLKHRVRDSVAHHDCVSARSGPSLRQLRLRCRILRKFLASNFVSPVAKRSLGELHDVALMDERHRLLALDDRVTDGHLDESLGPELGHRLDADRGLFANVAVELLAQIGRNLFRLWRARLPFDPSVYIFGVLAKNHHVDVLGLLDRGADSLEVANGANAGVEV